MQRKLGCYMPLSYTAVFDCERTEPFYSLLPKYVGFGLKVMEGVFSSKVLSGSAIFSVT